MRRGGRVGLRGGGPLRPGPRVVVAAPRPARLEEHQVAVYVTAIVLGVVLGRAAPGTAGSFAPAVTPALASLLFVTFLQVPVRHLVRDRPSGRFVAAALVVNFVAVPLVVAALFPMLPDDPAIRLGVLLVLLCPCVDYVIVFSGLAGADHRHLLAVTPLLLLAQMVALPVLLTAFLGPAALGDIVRVGPFVTAFATLIVGPLVLAGLVQAWAGPTGDRVRTALGTAMVPLMALTLITVVASQVPKIAAPGQVLPAVPVHVLFLLVMAPVGAGVARLFRLDPARSRSIVFTGATRNSLVVLPLALALPDRLAGVAVVVVAQTLVEVIGMVAYVRLVPRLVPGVLTAPPAGSAPRPSR